MSEQPPRPDEPDERVTPDEVAGERALERVEEIADDLDAPEDGPARGMRVLTAEQFSLAETIGGVRGLIESMAPGLVFVVVFVATEQLTPSLVSSVAVAMIAVAARLIQRTPVTQAFGGFLGVLIGVVWAWRSGDGRDYFAWGLWTNAAYLVALGISLLARWPLAGVVTEALRSGFGGTDLSKTGYVRPKWSVWRRDRALMRRYALATWLWVGLFGARLLVQVPLYTHDEVGWLGTARLVMGLPLWAAVLWFTWVLVRKPRGAGPSPASS